MGQGDGSFVPLLQATSWDKGTVLLSHKSEPRLQQFRYMSQCRCNIGMIDYGRGARRDVGKGALSTRPRPGHFPATAGKLLDAADAIPIALSCQENRPMTKPVPCSLVNGERWRLIGAATGSRQPTIPIAYCLDKGTRQSAIPNPSSLTPKSHSTAPAPRSLPRCTASSARRCPGCGSRIPFRLSPASSPGPSSPSARGSSHRWCP